MKTVFQCNGCGKSILVDVKGGLNIYDVHISWTCEECKKVNTK